MANICVDGSREHEVGSDDAEEEFEVRPDSGNAVYVCGERESKTMIRKNFDN